MTTSWRVERDGEFVRIDFRAADNRRIAQVNLLAEDADAFAEEVAEVANAE